VRIDISSVAKTYSIRMIATFISCTFWMVQGRVSLITLEHWAVGIKTAVISATVLLILSFMNIIKQNYKKIAKATITAIVVAIVDYFVHPGHFGLAGTEAILTGVTSASLVFIISMMILYVDAI